MASPRLYFAILYLLAINGLVAQYPSENPIGWEAIPRNSAIYSLSEGNQGIYFGTAGGLLYFDYFTQRVSIRSDLNFGISARTIYQIYEDPGTEAVWIVLADGIMYRLPSDDRWRQVSESALPVNFYGNGVTRIGGNDDGIWIDSNGLLTQLSVFSGQFMSQTSQLPAAPIHWNTSRYDFAFPPDVTDWFVNGDWLANAVDFTGPGFLTAATTISFRDREAKYWFGTDLGVLFRGDSHDHLLDIIQAGVHASHTTSMYQDGSKIWFADNPRYRTGEYAARDANYFLSSWDEQIGKWTYYSASESEAIRETGVNRMMRVGKELWLATDNGITTLNTRSREWNWIGIAAGLKDRLVRDMVLFKGQVFAMSDRGIFIINPKTRRAESVGSKRLRGEWVESICMNQSHVYVGTRSGIYQYNHEGDGAWELISGLKADRLWCDESDMVIVSNNLIFNGSIKTHDYQLLTSQLVKGNIHEINANKKFLWLATNVGAIAIDRQNF
ncbi:hypothetical protein ACFL6E_02030, partial [Candidatus Neomarinimicrobiota bacterium]